MLIWVAWHLRLLCGRPFDLSLLSIQQFSVIYCLTFQLKWQRLNSKAAQLLPNLLAFQIVQPNRMSKYAYQISYLSGFGASSNDSMTSGQSSPQICAERKIQISKKGTRHELSGIIRSSSAQASPCVTERIHTWIVSIIVEKTGLESCSSFQWWPSNFVFIRLTSPCIHQVVRGDIWKSSQQGKELYACLEHCHGSYTVIGHLRYSVFHKLDIATRQTLTATEMLS